MTKLILIAGIGSFVGGALRFIVSTLVGKIGNGFPLGTFIVNMLGCLIIGTLYGIISKHNLSAEMRTLLTVGFCGGFTTFSTFAYENLTMLKDGNLITFIAYSGLSLIVGIVAAWLGYQLYTAYTAH